MKRDRLRAVVVPPFPLDTATKAKIRAAARAYLKAELPRLEAAGLMPIAERDSPWIDRLQLWRRGERRSAAADLAKRLEEWLPTRWTGPSSSPRAEEIVEGLLRGYIAARVVEPYRYGRIMTTPAKAIGEFLELIEHPEQTWRVMRLLLDVDTRTVAGRMLHDVRIQPVRGLPETIAAEIPEGWAAADEVHATLGSSEPRTFLVAERTGRDGWIVAFDIREHLVHASTALRLITAGTIVEPLEVYGQIRMVHTGGPSATALDPEHASHWRRIGEVTPEELPGVDAIATRLCELDALARENIPPSLIVALSRFNRSHRWAPWGDVVIDLAIALEAALSTGEKDEITLRIKTRAANLLARPGDPPATIFADVAELLRLRGKVAHGEPIPQKRWQDLFAARGLSQVMIEDRLAVLFDRWRELVRRAILARLLLDADGAWKIGAYPRPGVDEVLVDPLARRDWRRAMRRQAAELGIARSIEPAPALRDFLHEPFSSGFEH